VQTFQNPDRIAKMPSGPQFGFYYTIASVPLMIAGTVAPDIFHLPVQMKEIIFFVCMAAALICLFVGAIKEKKAEVGRHLRPGYKRRMIAIYGMLGCGLGFIGFMGAYFWPDDHIKQTHEVAESVSDHQKNPDEMPLPLPPNAKFIYKDEIFLAISRPYTIDENNDLRLAFREIYDCINSHSEPIIANYDGPAPMFTREWLSIIEKQGPGAAIQKLNEIRTKVRFAATEPQDIVKRRPYFSDEIKGMIDDKGEIGGMNGSLNDYIEALKSIPHGASQQLIKLVVGNSEAKFEGAIKNYSGWIGRFNNKMMVAKDDLDRLMTIE
jgi:hypothetical protein